MSKSYVEVYFRIVKLLRDTIKSFDTLETMKKAELYSRYEQEIVYLRLQPVVVGIKQSNVDISLNKHNILIYFFVLTSGFWGRNFSYYSFYDVNVSR